MAEAQDMRSEQLTLGTMTLYHRDINSNIIDVVIADPSTRGALQAFFISADEVRAFIASGASKLPIYSTLGGEHTDG